ncbi:MAG TPA: DNA-binding protein [Desulfotomaculum sp.]|nr:MAG: DNA-binding protein with PD1-like DNA-binding motif [Desulfotomaculum sp. BICA1-6]HBX24656.1 DNA-binding protein [Desulfotomaculum sp.]
MKYSQGELGRVFVARVEHGDDLLGELKQLVQVENVEAGVFYVIGALKEATVVTGPEKCVLPPVPMFRNFNDGREIIGLGTMFRDGEEPLFHLHGALGRGDTALMGCIRGTSEVYLVAEVILLEIKGAGAGKELDPASGLKMLKF